MFVKQVQRTNVTVEDRRSVLLMAQSRKPDAVVEMTHEAFIRNTLKDRLGWPRREPAPESVKLAAKQLAQVLLARDKAAYEAKLQAEAEANKD